MQMTLQQLNPESFRKLTVTASDFHARLSALLESDEVSTIAEELCFLKSCDWLVSESLNYYSEKTLQDFLTTKKGGHSEPSSVQWMSWGTMSNGRCLTAKISESPKIGKGCSLSDILEERTDEKYFLSEKTQAKILTKR